MTSAFNQARQPKGIPVGGQFATSQRAEGGLSLVPDPDETDWGSTGVRAGSRTPWGEAQHVDHPAPGIAVASCAGHGGVKLSPERNAVIPSGLRKKSGWYEEDCESQIVGMYFPEAFPHYRGSGVADADQDAWRREAFEANVKNWFPDEYTKATGNPVTVEESSVLRDRAKQADKAAFRAEHADEFVTLGNGDNHADWIPDGYAACKARMDATGEERTFLMPRDAVITDGMYGQHAVVDPNRHLDVTDVVNAQPDRPWEWAPRTAPLQRGDDLCIDTNGLTVAQGARARTELDRQWRFRNDDGTETIESLGEHMKRVGVVGKKPHVDGDKVTYSVMYEGSRVTTVSKATYDALTSVPDVSDETDQAYVAKERARVRYEKARLATFGGLDSAGIAKRKAAEDDYQAASENYKRLSDAKTERARAWQAERTEMQKAAFARLLAERGMDLD